MASPQQHRARSHTCLPTCEIGTVLLRAFLFGNQMNSKLILGVALCDKGKFPTKENGKTTHIYSIWRGMLLRCYCPVTQAKKPTYIGCSVDERFLKFQSFAEWASMQVGIDKDWQLDKDILIIGNRVYGPDTCVMAPPELNKAMRRAVTRKDGLPIGVTLSQRGKPYRARVYLDNGRCSVGQYDTVQEAYIAHLKVKCKHMRCLADKWRKEIPEKLYDAILGNVAKWEAEITD